MVVRVIYFKRHYLLEIDKSMDICIKMQLLKVYQKLVLNFNEFFNKNYVKHIHYFIHKDYSHVVNSMAKTIPGLFMSRIRASRLCQI